MTTPPHPTALIETIELHSIDYVPHHERHGTLGSQATFWFLGNLNVTTMAVGFIGILAGTIFQAFHASQGAELGLPQMIQSRAQFGYRGVIVPLCAALFTFIGYNILNTILIASGLFATAGWNKVAVALLSSGLGTALAIWGHDWLHRAFRWAFWLNLPFFLVFTLALFGPHAQAGHADSGHFITAAFFTQVAAGASYNIGYAIFVSDFTRYLPPSTGRAPIIATVFMASSISAIWLIGLGAWLAVHVGADDVLLDLMHAGDGVYRGLGAVLVGVSAVALVAATGMNAYSAMLTTITAIDAFHPVRPTRSLRICCLLGVAALWVVVAIVFGGDVIDALNNCFVVMLYLLVPWTAVNLTDYFFVRRGHYAITQLFTPHGLYRAWGREGLLAYAIGFGASVPFCVMPGLFVGPAATALGGVDIGWLVGLAVTMPAYLVLMRGFDPASEAGAIAASDFALEAPQPG
jgi:purine-cytosine permease-like protein